MLISVCVLPYNTICKQLLKQTCFGLHSVEINQQFNASSPIPAALVASIPPPPNNVNTPYVCWEVTLGVAEYCKTGIALKVFNKLDPTAHKFVSLFNQEPCHQYVWRSAPVAWHINPSNRRKSSASQPGWVSPNSWPMQCREKNMLQPLSNINPIPKASSPLLSHYTHWAIIDSKLLQQKENSKMYKRLPDKTIWWSHLRLEDIVKMDLKRNRLQGLGLNSVDSWQEATRRIRWRCH
jgi:hypothetical protein